MAATERLTPERSSQSNNPPRSLHAIDKLCRRIEDKRSEIIGTARSSLMLDMRPELTKLFAELDALREELRAL